MAMSSGDKMGVWIIGFVVLMCILPIIIGLSYDLIDKSVNHDVILVEKQIELEKLKQKNPVKEVKENDTQRQDKNRPTSNPTGL